MSLLSTTGPPDQSGRRGLFSAGEIGTYLSSIGARGIVVHRRLADARGAGYRIVDRADIQVESPLTEASDVTIEPVVVDFRLLQASEARRLIATRNFDAARGVLERYLQAHPDDPAALEMAGDGGIAGIGVCDELELHQTYVVGVSGRKSAFKLGKESG